MGRRHSVFRVETVNPSPEKNELCPVNVPVWACSPGSMSKNAKRRRVPSRSPRPALYVSGMWSIRSFAAGGRPVQLPRPLRKAERKVAQVRAEFEVTREGLNLDNQLHKAEVAEARRPESVVSVGLRRERDESQIHNGTLVAELAESKLSLQTAVADFSFFTGGADGRKRGNVATR